MARITSGRAPSRELNALGVSALASNGFMLIWAGLLFSQLRCYVVAVTIGLWYHEQGRGAAYSARPSPRCPSCTALAWALGQSVGSL